jgi:hypothetical protein
MYKPPESHSLYSDSTRAGARMSFHKPRASSDLSFNSESPMRWLVIGVLDPSTAGPRRAMLTFCEATTGPG